MKLEILLFSNGSMLSNYNDGRPAYRYTGDWKKLKLLEKDMKLYKNSGLPDNEIVDEIDVKFVVIRENIVERIDVPEQHLSELTKLIKSK